MYFLFFFLLLIVDFSQMIKNLKNKVREQRWINNWKNLAKWERVWVFSVAQSQRFELLLLLLLRTTTLPPSPLSPTTTTTISTSTTLLLVLYKRSRQSPLRVQLRDKISIFNNGGVKNKKFTKVNLLYLFLFPRRLSIRTYLSAPERMLLQKNITHHINNNKKSNSNRG